MYALVDCNNFYASCERLFQPHLMGKPIVILSNNDGCIISRSDEACLNFDGMTITDYHDYGMQMKNRIRKWLSIPVCVGVAPTKALTKVANKIARKFPNQTQGVYVIDTAEKRIKALQWTKIEDVWGIGHRIISFFGHEFVGIMFFY